MSKTVGKGAGSPSKRRNDVAHYKYHVHLTNFIHIKNHFHMQKLKSMLDSKATGELPLLREVSALQKTRSLRDPTASSARSNYSTRATSARRVPRDRPPSGNGEVKRNFRRGKLRPSDFGDDDHRRKDQSAAEWSEDPWAGGAVGQNGCDSAEDEEATDLKQKPLRPRNSQSERPPRSGKPRPGNAGTLENWDTQSWIQDLGNVVEQGRDWRKEREQQRMQEQATKEEGRSAYKRVETGFHRNGEGWREEVARKKDDLLRGIAQKRLQQTPVQSGSVRSAAGDFHSEDDFTDGSEDGNLSTDMIDLDAATPRPHSQSPLLLRDGLRERASAGRRRRSRALSMSRRYPTDGQSPHSALSGEETSRAAFQRVEDLDVSTDFLRNGCGMPWYWSKIHRHRGRNFDIPGRSDSSRLREGTGRKTFGECGPDMHDWEPSHSELDTDTEALLRSTGKYDHGGHTADQDGDDETKDYLRKLGYRAGGDDGAKSFLQLGSLFWSGQLGAGESRHRSLSQKYRPKSFKELVGQNLVVKALSNAVMQGKIAPVYLFQGPRGTGKTSTARIFAAVLNCLSDSLTLRPCESCRECVALANRRSLDVTEVHVATNNGIESMREIMASVLLPPTSSRFRIFIIDECHMLTKEAWNGFLKCLEEPPERVVFLLITTDPEQLPRTAASRCQKFSFFNIKESEIVGRLRSLATKENLQVDDEALALIASQSDGSLRDAETMLDQLSLLGKDVSLPMVQELVGLVSEDKLVELLDMALSADTVSTVKCIRELLDAGAEPLALVNQLASLITNILAGSYNLSEAQRKNGFFQTHNLQEESESLRQALKVLSDAEKQLRVSNDRTTWLTAALLQFAPDRSLLFPTSSGATSVSQSPGTRILSGDRGNLEVHSSPLDQQWGKQAQMERQAFYVEPLPPSSASEVPESLHSVSRIDGTTFESQIEDNIHHPVDTSPFNSEQERQADAKALRAEAKQTAESSGLPASGNAEASTESGLNDITTLSHRKLDDIWNRVLEGIRALGLKEILQAQGKLQSLSFSEKGYAVAVIEFQRPDHKARAQRSRSTIAHALHMAVGCPVEVKLGLACLHEEDGKHFKKDQQCGHMDTSEQQSPVVVHQVESPVDGISNLSAAKRSQMEFSFRSTQQAFQNADADSIPSVGSSVFTSAALPSADVQRHVSQGSEPQQDKDNVENMWTRDRKYFPAHYAIHRSPDQLWGLKDGQELRRDIVVAAGTKKVSLGTVMTMSQGLEPEHDYASRLSKRAVVNQFDANEVAIRAFEQENLRLESRASNASLLCWKPSTPDDEEVFDKQRRQRKRDFFFKLVPCAKNNN